MWAYTKEAFCVLIGAALEAAHNDGVTFILEPFREANRICFGPGSAIDPAVLQEQITDEWAKKTVEAAQSFLAEKINEA
jgi:hypothetical protein